MSGSLTFTYTPRLDNEQLPAENNIRRNLGVDLTDGNNHVVSINIMSFGAIVVVDTLSFGHINLEMNITLGEPLTFGGAENITSSLFPFVESTSSFVGCMEAIVVNANTLSYGAILDREGVAPGCNRTDCTADSCINGGTCQDLWFATTCDCLFGYSGSRCEVLSLAHFPGDSFTLFPSLLPLSLSLEWSTAAEQGSIATLIEVSLHEDWRG